MSQNIRILVIEDEKNIQNFITSVLNSQHYQVISSLTGRDGLSQAASASPDLILLDLGLPDMDGMEIIRKIREWSDTPILVISARVQEDDKVLALDSGADDYITKPFGNSELLARIRTALRHINRLKTDTGQTNHPYRSHGLVIDFQKRLIIRNGAEIHLTQNEFKIVSLLAQNCGQVLTYDPVSYTHLDVYKRQLQNGCPEMIDRHKNNGDPFEHTSIQTSLSLHVLSLLHPVFCKSVSYTHLVLA